MCMYIYIYVYAMLLYVIVNRLLYPPHCFHTPFVDEQPPEFDIISVIMFCHLPITLGENKLT